MPSLKLCDQSHEDYAAYHPDFEAAEKPNNSETDAGWLVPAKTLYKSPRAVRGYGHRYSHRNLRAVDVSAFYVGGRCGRGNRFRDPVGYIVFRRWGPIYNPFERSNRRKEGQRGCETVAAWELLVLPREESDDERAQLGERIEMEFYSKPSTARGRQYSQKKEPRFLFGDRELRR
ncbi:hypothetical protein BS47DRAFT_1454029 [Hydnum rufescens UP504]|uniref:Uncharacterized protein n=1 Tax=Hydnum rufescens UP504 TaxID=1448309 RepID=A0A9P6AYL3_9AGAM|nr:hypothetical protein BS47DRAFT_1454029 [Hydnum rufescens UP504]